MKDEHGNGSQMADDYSDRSPAKQLCYLILLHTGACARRDWSTATEISIQIFYATKTMSLIDRIEARMIMEKISKQGGLDTKHTCLMYGKSDDNLEHLQA